MNVRLIVLCVCVFANERILATTLLDTLTQYADAKPEYPPTTKRAWGNSDFTEFHDKNLPYFFISFLESWGYRSHNFFSMSYFKASLEKVLAQRKLDKNNDTVAVKIKCPEQSKLLIISSLQGNFHRLVRTLQWLHKQGIIDEDLIIQRKEYYLFMNGYSMNGSAYALETLTLLLLLIERNPEHFFIIRSRQELNNNWHDFSLKRELKIRGRYFKGIYEDTPFTYELNLLFNSLPHVAFCYAAAHPHDFMRIDSDINEEDIIPETMMHTFFNEESSDSPRYLYKNQLLKSTTVPHIVASVSTETLRLKARHLSGLMLVEQDSETTFWRIFPAATSNDDSAVTAIEDSYVEVSIDTSLSTSHITFFERHGKTSDFVPGPRFNLITGISMQTSNEQSLKEPITIGSTMSLVSGVPYIGTEVKEGMITRINAENSLGGVQGHLLKTSIYNDDYSPNLSLQNIQKLVADSVHLILFPVGSPTLNIYFDYIKNNLISVLFPITGASIFRIATAPGVIYLRASYDDEIYFLIEHLIASIGARKFAFFYQDDSYGIGSAESAHRVLKDKKGMSWIDLPYTRGAILFEDQIKKIREYQPDAIGFFSTAQTGRLLILQMGINECINKYFFGISFVAEKSFLFFVKMYGLRFLFSSAVPNPATSQLPIAYEYRRAMDAQGKQYDRFSFESYIGTSLFIDVLQKLDEPITREKIMHGLESLHNYHYKGLTFNFNPDTRSLATSVWLEADGSREWIEKKIEKITPEQPMSVLDSHEGL